MSGCRCTIDQYLLAAVVYAQSLVDSCKQLNDSLSTRHTIKKPHIAVFREIYIPKTRITHGAISYVFHGVLDYALGFIGGRDIRESKPGVLHTYLTLDSLAKLWNLGFGHQRYHCWYY